MKLENLERVTHIYIQVNVKEKVNYRNTEIATSVSCCDEQEFG